MSWPTPTQAPTPVPQRARTSRGIDALLGILAAAFGLTVGMLVAALIGGAQFAPLDVVASSVIDVPPAPVKSWATSTFGTSAKTFVVVTTLLVVAAVAAWAGVRSRRRPMFGVSVMLIAGCVGALVAMLRPASALLAPLPSLVGGGAAAAAMWLLMRLSSSTAANDGEPAQEATGISRRGLLLGAGGVVVLGAAALAGARWITDRTSAVVSRVATLLPTPAQPLEPLPASVQAPVPDMTPFVTPNSSFYRIDTALITPQVEPATWTLSFEGMVAKPFTITYADLIAMPMVERDITIMCVSNPVGGDYIGTARWLGAPLMPLLERAGIQPGADQLLSTSIDGWTCSTPLDGLADREPLLAIGMNGEPLPIEHGFPVRMIVPGLYGFISATKWVSRINASTYAQEPAYWTVRGWATDAPVLTGARIDLPKGDVPAGATFIAGVAWAMNGDGISRVEVSIDAGPWQDAQLADEPSPRTWRQWWLPWNATPGMHTVTVRATNGRGETQTAEEHDVIPAGATGYPSRDIQVT